MLQSAIFGKAGIQILFKAALCFWLVWAGTWTLTVSRKAEMGMDKTEPWACLGLVISALAQRHKSRVQALLSRGHCPSPNSLLFLRRASLPPLP